MGVNCTGSLPDSARASDFFQLVDDFNEVRTVGVERVQHAGRRRLDDKALAAGATHFLVEGRQRLVAAGRAIFKRALDIRHGIDGTNVGNRNVNIGMHHGLHLLHFF